MGGERPMVAMVSGGGVGGSWDDGSGGGGGGGGCDGDSVDEVDCAASRESSSG